MFVLTVFINILANAGVEKEYQKFCENNYNSSICNDKNGLKEFHYQARELNNVNYLPVVSLNVKYNSLDSAEHLKEKYSINFLFNWKF